MSVRKDGRPLYFDHPLTWQDMVEYLPRGEERALRATLCEKSDESDDESVWEA